MNNQNTEQLRLSDYISYFEKEDLQVPNDYDEKLILFDKIIEEVNRYPQTFKKFINEKLVDFQQTKNLIQDLNNIKNQLEKLEIIQQETVIFTEISSILSNTSNIVRKVPHIFDPYKDLIVRGSKGTKYAVKWDNEPKFIFTINHQVLVDLLINLKKIVKPSQSGGETFQKSRISSIIKKFAELVPSIKEIYHPYVLYIQVPELFDHIINLSKELEVLLKPYTILDNTQFLKQDIENTIKNFELVRDHFVQKPEIKEIKLKGKFKDAYKNLHKLNFYISFKGTTYYRYY